MFRRFPMQRFLIMGGLIDEFAMLIEIIEKCADVMTFNDELSAGILLRGDTEL
jgi:hypothetical protein